MSSGRLAIMTCELRGVLMGLDPLTWDGPTAKQHVKAFADIERLAANGRLLALRRMEETNATAHDTERDASDWVANQTGTPAGKAKRDAETANGVEDGSLTEQALRDGSISADHAAEIGRVKDLDPSLEQELIESAKTEPFHKFKNRAQKLRAGAETGDERNARQKKLCQIRRWIDDDGMRRIMAIMTPEQAVAFEPILDAFIEAQFARARREGRREPAGVYAIEGLLELACLAKEHIHHVCPTAERVANTTAATDDEHNHSDGDVSGRTTTDRDTPDGPGPTPAGSGIFPPTPVPGETATKRRSDPRLNVRALLLIDLIALRRGDTFPGERCEIAGIGPINVDYARSLLGDAAIDILIRDGTDIRTVAHAGRSANSKQKAALLADMECEVRGCHNTRRLEIDHIVPYCESGETNTRDLGPKCDYHHDQKTHRGWTDGPRDPDGKRNLYPPGHQPPASNTDPDPPSLFPE